jgi:hypothetical protein
MPIDRNDTEARQARLDKMIEEFRAAQQRRLVKAGIVLWNRTEAAHQAAMACVEPAPDKVH